MADTGNQQQAAPARDMDAGVNEGVHKGTEPASPAAQPDQAEQAPTADTDPGLRERVQKDATPVSSTTQPRENRHAVGWLDITGTDILYPLVQGPDNTYYMTHTFLRKKNASGAIFMDCWNAPDFTDFNTVIYGHNMKDGSMFAGLREYRFQAYFDAHPFVEITLLDRKLIYRVFAAYTVKEGETTDFRGQGCVTELDRSQFILAARKRSTEIASRYAVSRNDRLLTLVTCAGGAQPWYWVVHAVLAGEEL